MYFPIIINIWKLLSITNNYTHPSMFLLLLTFNLPSKERKANLSDEEVVSEIIRTQSPVLIDVLYERYANKVYRKCMSFVKESSIAEDLTHDIFLKVYFNLASFKQKSKFSTWLYSITYNFCIDYLRKNKKQKMVSIEDYDGVVNNMEVESADDLKHIAVERLTKLLERVKVEEKMILLMKYRDNMSIKEIQSVFNISESAVKMRIKRAKEKVKKMHESTYRESYY